MLQQMTKNQSTITLDPFARRGVISTLTAIALLPIAVMCLFAINVAYMQLVRTELRRSTDAAARAGARTLSISQSEIDAVKKAKDVAKLNIVAGSPLSLKNSQIEVGSITPTNTNQRMVFSKGGTVLNAVRVNGERTSGSQDGSVTLLASGLLKTSQFEPSMSATAMQYDRDIVIVIDRSSSMAFAWDEAGNNVGSNVPRDSPPGWQFTSPWDYDCRWMDMVNAVKQFLLRLEDTRQSEIVSMASFESGPRSRLDVPLTDDYQQILDRLEHYTQGDHNRSSTNIGSGMEFALEGLADMSRRRPYAQPVMIVMTDGINKRGPSPMDLAQTAASRNILIYTITFSDEADTDLMSAVAAAGNGKHFHAITPDELTTAFEEVANTIPTILTD